ncbi:MAG: diguanylate cyclase [Pirellulales bacterium]|nr:diguanylate cyclase [Pirellulales bacterium]
MALSAIVGISVGWWFRGGNSAGLAAYDADNSDTGVDRAGEVLARLQDLAARMASDVGEHSSKVREANDELAAAGKGDTETVVRTVTKLLDANEKMQEQLASAENRLQEQARKIESYAAEARTDPLTGLPNRRAFDAEISYRLSEYHRTGKPFCVVMIDVDHFKKFNDTYGHQAGDEVLSEVAEVLRRTAGPHDMPARFGGEEFVVVLHATAVSEAEPRVERIRRAIADVSFDFAGQAARVTASLGLAQLLGGENAVGVIERADAALYAAKDAGRNRAYWHDGHATHPIAQQPDAAPPQPVAEKSSPACRPQTEPPSPARTAARPEVECEARQEEDPAAHTPSDRERPNRMVFCTLLRHRVAEWQRGGAPPSVVLVRIDEFDRLSQFQGQRVAGMLLEVTARYLRAATRGGDLVAQYDDTTFGLLLPGAGMANVIAVAERLRKTIAESRLSFDGKEHRFTVSVGGAEISQGDDVQRLLHRSEEALSASIKSGGNCCYFHNGHWSETVAAAQERLASA